MLLRLNCEAFIFNRYHVCFKADVTLLYLSVGVQVGGRDLQSDQILCPFVELLSNEAGLLSQQPSPNDLLFKSSQAAGYHGLSVTQRHDDSQPRCAEAPGFLLWGPIRQREQRYLSSLQRRTRLFEPADNTAAVALPGTPDGFSGVTRWRSCCSSCSYICLWRSRAQRFSSWCCFSRVCNTDCNGSAGGHGEDN